MSKMTLLLKELDCPHCAEKIEKRVGELSGVKALALTLSIKSSQLILTAIKTPSLPR